ncbi:O-antigen ligase family protein [Kribbella speibonae]|uniref:O-antigen ligase domain-containing protein n=1 Tax=Kribbella speibonae TaxID=1572660 RepID=A0A4R0IZ58_9ACTN|nr:O-antigen ligase domain-containing protein [Kribbella speibonae]TCC23694.1 O-antigen ligase domain-containing protein [Kribbella speibonae]TCC38260.1 O-antigen ligase domain-containing protein [Kribbella speibonae]
MTMLATRLGHQLTTRLGRRPTRRVVAPDVRRRRRVQLTWALLVLNVMTFFPGAPHLLPIPGSVGKLIAQGALVGALMMVLSVNRPVRVRPSVYIALLMTLAVEALLASIRAEFLLGALFRAGRLCGFALVLWLLTPWWTRRDLLLVRTHLMVLWAIVGSVVVGLIVAPGLAMTDDRLGGALWPIPPTQVGHYTAVAIGLTVVLWMSGLLRRSAALTSVLVCLPVLLLTHTRTALVAVVAGVTIAGLSLFTARTRVRRAFLIGLAVFTLGALTLSSVVTTWLARGQDPDELGALTGRKAVWDAILAQPRSTFETFFGFGLSNKSFNGLPIDSNWLGTYYDVGLVGCAITVLLLVFVLTAAWFRPQGPHRALALFLVAYCVVASFTESGLSEASPYLLELTLAASLVYSTSTREGPR